MQCDHFTLELFTGVGISIGLVMGIVIIIAMVRPGLMPPCPVPPHPTIASPAAQTVLLAPSPSLYRTATPQPWGNTSPNDNLSPTVHNNFLHILTASFIILPITALGRFRSSGLSAITQHIDVSAEWQPVEVKQEEERNKKRQYTVYYCSLSSVTRSLACIVHTF